MMHKRIHKKEKYIVGCIFFVFIGSLMAQTNDSLYIQRYNHLSVSSKISYHSVVTPKINQKLKQQTLSESLSVFEACRSFFDSVLTEYGVDKDFAYITMAISDMNTKYQSKYFHKAGIWALPYVVAVHYGLTVNDSIDERFDIRKSTIAAAKYLRQLTNTFDNFAEVLLAYANSPIELKNNKTNAGLQSASIWYLYENRDFYHRDILPDYIAAVYFANFYKNHQILLRQTEKPLVDTVYLSHKVAYRQLKKYLQIDSAGLYAQNPCLTSNCLPSNYPIVLPKNKIADFYQWEDSLYIFDVVDMNAESEPKEQTEETHRSETKYHIVKSGDILGKLATKYHISVGMLKKWNNLKNDMIYIGQKLIVSKGHNHHEVAEKTERIEKIEAVEEKQPTQQSAEKKSIVYVVRNGDTLGHIAKKYNISIAVLKKQNNLKTDKIFVGQRLTIEK